MLTQKNQTSWANNILLQLKKENKKQNEIHLKNLNFLLLDSTNQTTS